MSPRLRRTVAALALAPALALTLAAPPTAAQDGSWPPADLRCPEISSAPPLAGTLAVVAKFEARALLLDLATGTTRASLPVGDGPHELVVSPDGTRVVVANYGGAGRGSSLTVIDLPTATVERTIQVGADGEERGLHGLAWLAGDRVVVTSERTNTLAVVDVVTGELHTELDTAQRTSHMVVLDAARTRAFTGNILPGSVSLVDLAGETPTQVVAGAHVGEGLALTPDGRELWVTRSASAQREGGVAVLDAHSGELLAELACPGSPHRVLALADNATLLVGCLASNDVAVFDRASRELRARLPNADDAVPAVDGALGPGVPPGPLPSALLAHPDGRHALLANINSCTVSVFDLRAEGGPAAVGVLAVGFGPDGMGWSPLACEPAER